MAGHWKDEEHEPFDFEEYEGEMKDSALKERELDLTDCIDLTQRLLNAVKEDDICVWDDVDNGQTLIVIPLISETEPSE